MEIKGLDIINKVVNDFVSEWDCTAKAGANFAYYYLKDEISWTLLITEDADRYFQSFLKKNFPDITANVFIWSLFHEVGHHETIDMWSDEEQEEFDRIKDELEKEYGKEKDKSLSYKYFSLPDEFEATCWAAEYMRTYPEKVKQLFEKLSVAVRKFYELNEVEDAA